MTIRLVSIVILVAWSAGCSRQHKQQSVSALPDEQGTAATGSAAVPPATPKDRLIPVPRGRATVALVSGTLLWRKDFLTQPFRSR